MKKPLGRGLDSLIPRKNTVERSESSANNGLLELDITSVIPNENQPRKMFDDVLLNELAESIKLKGVILPIVVTKVDDKYMIIEGERRWRASGLAEKKTIPAVVKSVDTDKERLELALITNAQREDLNAIELASAYKELIEIHNYRQEDLGKIVGKSRAAVANRLRLLTLPKEACKAIERKQISEGHARALLSLDKQGDMITLMNLIIDKSLTVRDAEKLAKKMNEGEQIKVEKQPAVENPDMKNVTSEFESFFNSKVNIKAKKKGGVIEIKYSSDDELDVIIKKIRGEVC